MRKYLVNALVSICLGVLYIKGFYIVSLCLLSIFNLVFAYNNKSKKSIDLRKSFDLLNCSGLVFIFVIVINGLVLNRLKLMEMLIVVCVGFDLLSIWVTLILGIEYFYAKK